ncbi:hypothetical protein GN109_06085 [Collimonas pratensis]|uniref:hypothetical protein n=1 Tax=Collimonas pratensis TaxID=279113 RepID=UPI00143D1F85|nr:hypothetical protein [Collimonas pratensis]NKI68983.1 hypothetical protein [Collimonas pratensis]
MTAIVAIKHAGIVYIGGDSAGSSNSQIRVRKDCKVHKVGSVIFGFSGSFRVGQLLAHALQFPARPAGLDAAAFMVTLVADAVRECLKVGGCDIADGSGVEVLIGYQGHIFNLQGDYQVEELTKPYNAIGSGAEIALGALYATEAANMAPEDRIKLALKAAEHFCTEVSGPFHIIHS